MTIVPNGEHAADAVGRPRFWRRGLCGGGAAHLAHALHAGMHAGGPPPVVLSSSLPSAAVFTRRAGFVAHHKTQIFEAVDRRMRQNGVSRRHRATITSVSS